MTLYKYTCIMLILVERKKEVYVCGEGGIAINYSM